MEQLVLEGLLGRVSKGSLLRLVIEVGQVDKQHIGAIWVGDGSATIELADGMARRCAKKLDGHRFNGAELAAWVDSAETLNPHIQQLERWLKLESDAEKQTDSRQAVLTKLTVRNHEIGFGERFIVELGPRNTQQKLPWSSLSTGAPIILLEDGATPSDGVRGIVSRVRARTISVALNREPEPKSDNPTYALLRSSDEVVRQRMQRVLRRVSAARGDRSAELRDVLLGQNAPAFAKQHVAIDAAITASLNPSQQEAVQHALQAQDVAIVHGPPGTGKTTTLVAIMRAAVAQKQRVLACAPSNMAVDNLCEALVRHGVKIVRLGHPARVLPSVQPFTLDALVAEHADFRTARGYRKDAYSLRQSSRKFRRAKPEKGEKQAMRDEAKAMLSDARQLELQAVEHVLNSAEIILATLTGLDSALLGQRQFDLCVVDEAGQSPETATWMPVPRVNRLILAGDHQQLPPTILSDVAAREGYAVSMLERLMKQDDTLSRQLVTQYRMHEQIMGFSSAEFYNETLAADSNVQHHLLTELENVATTPLTETALTYIDTAGASYDEEREPDGPSTQNPEEAQLVVKKVQQLLDAGVAAADIGVITPYGAQVRLLREFIADGVEVNSIDGFQGREKKRYSFRWCGQIVREKSGF